MAIRTRQISGYIYKVCAHGIVSPRSCFRQKRVAPGPRCSRRNFGTRATGGDIFLYRMQSERINPAEKGGTFIIYRKQLNIWMPFIEQNLLQRFFLCFHFFPGSRTCKSRLQ